MLHTHSLYLSVLYCTYGDRGAGAGPAGPANAGPMFTPKSRNKRARSWNSNWAAVAQAVNARAAVASSAYIALSYCEVKQL